MPLLAGKQNVGKNISEMERAGHSRASSIASAVREAGVKRKGTTMKHEDGMAGEKGMKPKKAIASGLVKAGNFGVEPFHETHGGMGPHPDHTAHTGMKGVMGDHERGTPPAIHHAKGHHPAQAAPNHGGTHVAGYGLHSNSGKV